MAKLSKSVAAAGAVVASLSILVVGASGCGASCDTSDNTPEVFTGGLAKDDVYASSSSLGPLLHFPGGKEFQLVHHLGFTPADVNVYFSIDIDRYAPCAGNSCEIRCIDDQIVWVKNDTCTEFWIYVTASGPSPIPVARCNGDNVYIDADVDAGVVLDEATTGESGTEESSSDSEAPDAGGSDI